MATNITPGIPKKPTIIADNHETEIPGIKICKTYKIIPPMIELIKMLANNFIDFPIIFKINKIIAKATAKVTNDEANPICHPPYSI